MSLENSKVSMTVSTPPIIPDQNKLIKVKSKNDVSRYIEQIVQGSTSLKGITIYKGTAEVKKNILGTRCKIIQVCTVEIKYTIGNEEKVAIIQTKIKNVQKKSALEKIKSVFNKMFDKEEDVTLALLTQRNDEEFGSIFNAIKKVGENKAAEEVDHALEVTKVNGSDSDAGPMHYIAALGNAMASGVKNAASWLFSFGAKEPIGEPNKEEGGPTVAEVEEDIPVSLENMPVPQALQPIGVKSSSLNESIKQLIQDGASIKGINIYKGEENIRKKWFGTRCKIEQLCTVVIRYEIGGTETAVAIKTKVKETSKANMLEMIRKRVENNLNNSDGGITSKTQKIISNKFQEIKEFAEKEIESRKIKKNSPSTGATGVEEKNPQDIPTSLVPLQAWFPEDKILTDFLTHFLTPAANNIISCIKDGDQYKIKFNKNIDIGRTTPETAKLGYILGDELIFKYDEKNKKIVFLSEVVSEIRAAITFRSFILKEIESEPASNGVAVRSQYACNSRLVKSRFDAKLKERVNDPEQHMECTAPEGIYTVHTSKKEFNLSLNK